MFVKGHKTELINILRTHCPIRGNVLKNFANFTDDGYLTYIDISGPFAGIFICCEEIFSFAEEKEIKYRINCLQAVEEPKINQDHPINLLKTVGNKQKDPNETDISVNSSGAETKHFDYSEKANSEKLRSPKLDGIFFQRLKKAYDRSKNFGNKFEKNFYFIEKPILALAFVKLGG